MTRRLSSVGPVSSEIGRIREWKGLVRSTAVAKALLPNPISMIWVKMEGVQCVCYVHKMPDYEQRGERGFVDGVCYSREPAAIDASQPYVHNLPCLCLWPACA